MWYSFAKKKSYDSVMIAFYLPKSIAKKMAVKDKHLPDGLEIDLSPPEEMHMTLLILPDADSLKPKLKLVQACLEQLASEYPVMHGKLGGLGVFAPDGNQPNPEMAHPIYYSFDGPELPKFHSELTSRLKNLGIPISDDHGFTPHVTIGFTKSGTRGSDVLPWIDFKPVEIDFKEIHLRWGDADMGQYKLTG